MIFTPSTTPEKLKKHSESQMAKSKKESQSINELEIVDQIAYKEWLKICKDPLITSDRTFYASDGSEIDLMSGFSILDKKIAHLLMQERNEIREQASKRRSLINQKHQLWRKAFGIKAFIKKKDAEEGGGAILDLKKAEIIDLFSRFYSLAEVHRICIEDWGYSVGIDAIRLFRERHSQEVKEGQEAYKRDYADLRLGYKRSRLDELSYLYNERKTSFEKTKSREDQKLLQATLEQIRKEVEGDKLTIDGALTLDVQHTINLHIQKEVVRDLNILDIVIAKIAGKQNKNPRMIVAKLHNSIYNRFNGLGQQFDFDQTPLYPSDEHFDFAHIKRLYEDNHFQEAQLIPLSTPDLNQSDLDKASQRKLRLQQLIASKKEELIESQIRMQGYQEGVQELPKTPDIVKVTKSNKNKK